MVPADVSASLRRAIEFHQAGQLAQAEPLYREVLALDPNNIDALHHLGLIGYQVGQHAAASEILARAAALAPEDATIQANFGETLRAAGRPTEALAHLQQAIALRPTYSTARNNLGNTLAALGRLDEALASYQRALAIQPNYAIAWRNLGELHKTRRKYSEAIDAFQQAIAHQPNSAEAHDSLGSVLVLLTRYDEALPCFQRALELSPNFVDALNHLAALLGLRGEAAAAVEMFRRALQLAPHRADIHSNLILQMQYAQGDNATALAAELEHWDRRHAAPCAPGIVLLGNDRSPERRLRIGYVSPDFRDHVVGYNILPLFIHRTREFFEAYAYSSVAQPDALTARFRAAVDHWRDAAPLNDGQLAALVRQDEIDVLVDLSLHTAKNRLPTFAHKPAPLQVSFAGYPGGTGLQAMDWHLTDPHLEPPLNAARASYDRPFPLPRSFWCYAELATHAPVEPVNALPALTSGRVTFGCLNNLVKITAATLELWAGVLRAVPTSHLLLLASPGFARERVRAALEAAGIAGERIEFADRQPRIGYFALYRQIDIGLDTFPYHGHTTSLDAYWMGVPVVTLVGPTPVSRAGLSQLSNLGLADLTAKTPAEFVQTATALARDLPRLAMLRAGLRERLQRSPLMDGPGFARDVEAAYRTLWREWCETK
jgi:protein O-GlcNAc transferase